MIHFLHIQVKSANIKVASPEVFRAKDCRRRRRQKRNEGEHFQSGSSPLEEGGKQLLPLMLMKVPLLVVGLAILELHFSLHIALPAIWIAIWYFGTHL